MKDLPVHSLNNNDKSLTILPIAHSNSYNFTLKHRHTYYEIILFEKGGGIQLIDLKEYPVENYSCYIVHPQQIHLLNRAPGSMGRVIQFEEHILASSQLITLLEGRVWQGAGAIFFENNKNLFEEFSNLIDLFNNDSSKNSNERDRHLLQVLLFDLLNKSENDFSSNAADANFNNFLQLVNDNFRNQHSVQFYLRDLAISEKKLGTLSKSHMGISPLKVIHHRLLLEVKRLLLFNEDSHKEIAYTLGFDSPSSFSSFVKMKTGKTPSELQSELEGIHK
ncbi:MAG: helix-turn-helix domain-containing protein [Crocinitomicaceae bacterium]|nr:helix-turn-helix domain-containing protein [Crocinitomicaceae bacterium]